MSIQSIDIVLIYAGSERSYCAWIAQEFKFVQENTTLQRLFSSSSKHNAESALATSESINIPWNLLELFISMFLNDNYALGYEINSLLVSTYSLEFFLLWESINVFSPRFSCTRLRLKRCFWRNWQAKVWKYGFNKVLSWPTFPHVLHQSQTSFFFRNKPSSYDD